MLPILPSFLSCQITPFAYFFKFFHRHFFGWLLIFYFLKNPAAPSSAIDILTCSSPPTGRGLDDTWSHGPRVGGSRPAVVGQQSVRSRPDPLGVIARLVRTRWHQVLSIHFQLSFRFSTCSPPPAACSSPPSGCGLPARHHQVAVACLATNQSFLPADHQLELSACLAASWN